MRNWLSNNLLYLQPQVRTRMHEPLATMAQIRLEIKCICIDTATAQHSKKVTENGASLALLETCLIVFHWIFQSEWGCTPEEPPANESALIDSCQHCNKVFLCSLLLRHLISASVRLRISFGESRADGVLMWLPCR